MKRLLSGFLALLMVLSNIPVYAFAAEPEESVKISLEASSELARENDEVTFTMYVEAKENTTAGWEATLAIPEGLTYVPDSGALNADFAATVGADGQYDECSYEDGTNVIIVMDMESALSFEGKVEVMTFRCKVKENAEVGEYTVGLKDYYVYDANRKDMDSSGYSYTPASITVTDLDGNVRISLESSSETAATNDIVTFTMYVEALENVTAGWEATLAIPKGLTYVPDSGAFDTDFAATVGADGQYDECSYEDGTNVIIVMDMESALTVKGKVKVMTFQCKVDENAVTGDYTIGLDDYYVYNASRKDMDPSEYTCVPAVISVTSTANIHTCSNPTKVDGQAATCTDDGWKDHYKCSDADCGKLYADAACTIEITELGAWKSGDGKIPAAHTPVKQDGQSADCKTGTDGWKDYYQCDCGDHFEDEAAATKIENLDAWKTGDGKIPASHDYGDLVEEVPATHTADKLEGGFHAYFCCGNCGGYFDSDRNPTTEEALTIPAPAHDSKEVIPAVAATCSQTGLTEGKKCSVCKKVMEAQEVTSILGHSYDEGVVTTKPTCTAAGVKTFTCGGCGHTYTEPVNSLGHTKVEIPEVPATCTTDGATAGEKCSACGETLTAPTVVPALKHDWDAEITYQWNADFTQCTATRVCKNADHPETVSADKIEEKIEQEANCQQIGKFRYVASFTGDNSWAGETKSEVFEQDRNPAVHPADKVESFNYTPPTCTEPAKRAGTRCTACNTVITGGTVVASTPALGHDYKAVVTPDTCTEDGYTTYTCARKDCGDSYVGDRITAQGHKNAEAVVENQVDATCTVDGSYDSVVYCSVCNAEQSRENKVIPASGHAEGEAVKENDVAATCTADGSYDSVVYCTVCKEEISRVPTTVGALGHTDGEAVKENEVAATCTADGSYDAVIYCTVCREEVSRVPTTVGALGHDESGAAATCETDQVCARIGCDHVIQEKLGHDASGTEATCMNPQICARTGCNYVIEAALGHDEVDHGTKAPTCTEVGWFVYKTCSRCDYMIYSERAALNHAIKTVAATAPTCTAIGWDAYEKCTRNGCDYSTYAEQEALGHDEVAVEAKAPTCLDVGWDAYVECSRCDYDTYEEQAALGHDKVAHVAKAPTCTEIGWDAYETCSRCEDYNTYVEKKARGHNVISHIAQAPTCTAIGWDAYETCSRCGDYNTYVEKEALGHDEVAYEAKAPTCTDIGWDAYVKCSRCNDYNTYEEKAALGHELVDHEAQEPACGVAGWYAYQTCKNCMHTTYKEIAALKHQEITDKAVAPTCEATGLTEGKHCSVCNEVLVKQEVVDALGHTEVIDAAVAPKCDTTGLTEGKHCSVCNKVLAAQEEVPATGHQMAEASCTRPSACENKGCGYTEGEALGHTEVKDEDRMALCEDTGLTEGSHCSVCDQVLIPQEIIPALGHDIHQFEAKKATYTGAGWDAYEACSRCAYTTKVEIPALGALKINDYNTFITRLAQLEEVAHHYVLENPGKDPAALVIKYIRTGVERYNSGSWGIMAGYEDAAFAEYVNTMEDAYNCALADGEEMLAISSLKNLKNFKLPNGNTADMGHIFGMMDITYHNSFSLNHMDVGGWIGDTVDLLSLADQFGVSGTVEEMVADLTANYLLKPDSSFPAKPNEGSFGLTDMQGDLDGYYIMHKLQTMEYDNGTLTSLLSSYFTESLTDEDRADYLLKNRLGSVTLREEVRKAVYNAYTGNKMVKTLEDTREFTSSDLANLKKACCYAVADYLCRMAGDFVDVTENPYYEVFSSESSTLAPGITQDIKYATSADNKQMVFYIATVDVNRSDVDVFANYTNNDPTVHAMSRVLDQANFAQEKYGNPESEHYIENYNVIASVNGAGYNMSTGEPSGVLVMHNGVEYHPMDHQGFFGILKDGTPVIGTAQEYKTTYKGQVRDAIAGFGDLVRNGQVVASDNSTRASRTAVGITKTGKVVLMVLDGRQEPFSCGGSMKEIAQIMMEAGCETAINLDGGGSTTFVAKPEGGTELEVVNRPSDGSARSVSTSLLMVSTAPSSTAFDHAILTTETNYMTVGSSQKVTAEGVSATGNEAEIPEGATWDVSSTQYGEITSDGVFTAKQTGSVEICLIHEGKVIGSKIVNIVVPNNVYFTKSKIDLVYGDVVELPVKALYDGKPVTVVESDLVFTLEKPEAGTVDDFKFYCNENGTVKRTKLTVKLAHDGTVSASITLAMYNQGEATFNFDKATGGDRQLAWDRQVSNTTTEDANTYYVKDTSKDMVTSYIFAIDMTQIPIPSQLNDLIYMLPGSDMEGASAWTFLMSLAQRVSTLTEVTPTVTFDANMDVDYSGLTLVNEFFELKDATLDPETNTLKVTLNWKKQTQAIDPAEANPMCILSGIKLTPKDDAAWTDKGSLTVTNSGKIGYEIYLRASSLYTFAQKPENQATFDLKPFVNPDDPTEAGASFRDIYHTFEDSYTLINVLRNGWITEDGGFAYYDNGERYTGIHKIDGYYYDFGANGINIGKTMYTGVFYDAEANAYRCAKNGVLQSGWNMINNEWYYFAGNYNAVSGKQTIGGLEYTFEDNGRLTTGVWVHKAEGSMYSYGPAYHYEGWKVIEGETYYFENHYCYKGWYPVNESNSHQDVWYDFGDDGAMIERLHYTGLLEWKGNLYYLVDGISQYGLQYVDGYYYYFKTGYTAVKGNYYVTKNNGLLASGTYAFGDDYRMKNGIYLEDGEMYYYELGQKAYAGLIQIDGYYYYVNGKYKVVTGSYYVSKTNNLMKADTYLFDDDGRMIRGTGIFNIDGTLYYYKNGAKNAAGLVYLDGYYYYAGDKGKLAIGTHNISKTNGLLPSGSYDFDEMGRMIIHGGGDDEPDKPSEPVDPDLKNGIIKEDGTLYYYVNGVKTYAGLIRIDGNYYYVNGKCIVVTGRYYVTKNNGLMESGYYNFDDEGRMMIAGNEPDEPSTPTEPSEPTTPSEPVDPDLKNGIIKEDGTLYYYVNGVKTYAGLIRIDGDYYYVNGKCIVVTGRYYVTKNNGLMESGNYNFDEEGRMITEDQPTNPELKNGIINEGGTLYYYVNGVKTYAGLIKIDGYYYYINGKCIAVTGTYYVTKNNGLMPSANYQFDANGRMILK